MNSMYYDKNDQPLTGKDACIKWAKQFEKDSKGRVVSQQTTWLGFWISTVWIGLNSNLGEGKPHIYETMVFRGGWSDVDMERYSTRKEATAGHRQMFLKWNNPLYVIRWLIRNRGRRING